jgi:hypothetical protein
MKLHATLLAACIGAAAATSASAQTTPPPAPADSAAPAPRAAAPAPAPAAPRPRVRRNPNVITAAELEGQVASDVYELVRRLRPQWLRGRASSTNGDQTKSLGSDPLVTPDPAHAGVPVYVFFDGSRMGDAGELRRLQVGSVRELRFIPAEDAVTRWGRDFSAGAIEVSSR